jgi:hypothetical protein
MSNSNNNSFFIGINNQAGFVHFTLNGQRLTSSRTSFDAYAVGELNRLLRNKPLRHPLTGNAMSLDNLKKILKSVLDGRQIVPEKDTRSLRFLRDSLHAALTRGDSASVDLVDTYLDLKPLMMMHSDDLVDSIIMLRSDVRVRFKSFIARHATFLYLASGPDVPVVEKVTASLVATQKWISLGTLIGNHSTWAFGMEESNVPVLKAIVKAIPATVRRDLDIASRILKRVAIRTDTKYGPFGLKRDTMRAWDALEILWNGFKLDVANGYILFYLQTLFTNHRLTPDQVLEHVKKLTNLLGTEPINFIGKLEYYTSANGTSAVRDPSVNVLVLIIHAMTEVHRIKPSNVLIHGGRPYSVITKPLVITILRYFSRTKLDPDVGRPNIFQLHDPWDVVETIFRPPLRYTVRLHNNVVARDMISTNVIPLHRAVVIHPPSKEEKHIPIRHIFDRTTVNQMLKHGSSWENEHGFTYARRPKHPFTQKVFGPSKVYKLADILHPDDKRHYLRIQNAAANNATIGSVRGPLNTKKRARSSPTNAGPSPKR